MPSSFTAPLETQYVGRGLRKVLRQFEYRLGHENSDNKIVVPRGFLTDFASVPWPASMFIPKDGDYNQAAVLHDYLYSVRGYHNPKMPRLTRKECDDIFLDAMTTLDSSPYFSIPLWKRRIMYRAVRIGAWLAWKSRVRSEKIDSIQSANDKNNS